MPPQPSPVDHHGQTAELFGAHYVVIAVRQSQLEPVSTSYALHVRGRPIGRTVANVELRHKVYQFVSAYVGGGDTVRSFREIRFRDDNAGHLKETTHGSVFRRPRSSGDILDSSRYRGESAGRNVRTYSIKDENGLSSRWRSPICSSLAGPSDDCGESVV